ncbi:hypothetical protein [Arthrobacter sp. NPDC056727]|uniref:hypothetical protein n=1 Tax=Arthrobacter sp. NPDC056727 TaxID=3345927 RepID=UPI00366F8C68
MSDFAMNEGAMTDGELCCLLAGPLNSTVDPAVTLAAVPDAPLARLADGLFRHLDTPSPAFGARFWFLQATEELRRRRLAGPGSASGAGLETQSGPGPLASEVPAG